MILLEGLNYMQIDIEALRQYYRDMSNDQLISMDRNDLTEEAQRIYDDEIKRRRWNKALFSREDSEDGGDSFYSGSSRLEEEEDDPDWMKNSACACAFTEHPGSDAAQTAAKAMGVLRAAGIPSRITETEEGEGRKTLNVMVPGASIMHATSIVDRDLLNNEYETEWRTHLESLLDRELMTLNPNVFCAGMLDRVARITKSYADEMERRNLKPVKR
jgi:hypothetical protein